MPESITPHENLEHIFNGILSLNQDGQHISQGKRQLDTKRPYPDIWVNNVSEDTSDEATNGEEASSEDVGSASDDDTPETYYPIEPEIAAQEMVDDELSHKIALWLHSIQAHGFSPVRIYFSKKGFPIYMVNDFFLSFSLGDIAKVHGC